jgi:hypothetical protein
MTGGVLEFHVVFWDYVTSSSSSLPFSPPAFLFWVFPGRIAIARNISFLAIVPWIQALISAFEAAPEYPAGSVYCEDSPEASSGLGRCHRLHKP